MPSTDKYVESFFRIMGGSLVMTDEQAKVAHRGLTAYIDETLGGYAPFTGSIHHIEKSGCSLEIHDRRWMVTYTLHEQVTFDWDFSSGRVENLHVWGSDMDLAYPLAYEAVPYAQGALVRIAQVHERMSQNLFSLLSRGTSAELRERTGHGIREE